MSWWTRFWDQFGSRCGYEGCKHPLQYTAYWYDNGQVVGFEDGCREHILDASVAYYKREYGSESEVGVNIEVTETRDSIPDKGLTIRVQAAVEQAQSELEDQS